jgi:hypothetical protein
MTLQNIRSYTGLRMEQTTADSTFRFAKIRPLWIGLAQRRSIILIDRSDCLWPIRNKEFARLRAFY